MFYTLQQFFRKTIVYLLTFNFNRQDLYITLSTIISSLHQIILYRAHDLTIINEINKLVGGTRTNYDLIKILLLLIEN